MQSTVYPNAPIREALFDVRLKFSNPINPSIFEGIFSSLQDDYTKKEVSVLRHFSVEAKGLEQPVFNTTDGVNGLRLTSKDGTQIAQFRTDGFTFSKLKPYSKWDVFFTEVTRLFELYVEATKPLYCERIALRYVNAIEIAEKKFEIDDYFTTALKIGDDIPDDLVEFFVRIVLKDRDSDSLAVVNQTVEETTDPDKTIVLFDIDVFQQNLRTIWKTEDFMNRVNQLHAFRTKIFEGSLTDKTKQSFS